MSLRTLAVSALIIFVAGCSSEPPLTPVSGKVTLDGAPMSKGDISFRSTDPSIKDEPYAKIEADGTFKVMTKGRPGSPKGKFGVLVTAYEDLDPKNASAAPKSIIPRRYAEKAILSLDVPSASYDLSLTSKP